MSFKFESLDVWKRSVDYADAMFSLTKTLPQKYQFSLGEQYRLYYQEADEIAAILSVLISRN